MKHRVVLGEQRRWPIYALMGVLLIAAISGWLLALSAINRVSIPFIEVPDADKARLEMRAKNEALARRLRSAEAMADDVRGSTIFQAQSCDLDTLACTELRESVSALQAESAQLREQLAFYRSVATPKQSRAGVRIVRLELRKGDAKQRWDYDLTLLQPVRRNQHVSGQYRITLEGIQAKKLKSFTMDPVIVPTDGGAMFSFKTFATLSGSISLPDGFRPQRVEVTLLVDGGGDRKPVTEVSESYTWSKLVAAAGK